VTAVAQHASDVAAVAAVALTQTPAELITISDAKAAVGFRQDCPDSVRMHLPY
jgi:hypothetical protein